MSWVILLLIRIYWLTPVKWRRQCLFKESCSNHVYKITKEQGVLKGYEAFIKRFNTCRPNYGFYETEDGRQWVILNDQSAVDRSITNV